MNQAWKVLVFNSITQRGTILVIDTLSDKQYTNSCIDTVLNCFTFILTLYCNQINTTSVTSGAGTAYPSGAPAFTPGLQRGSYFSIFSFICMFCRSLFVLLYFFFWPLCSVFLRYTDSDYPFGIFKLFLKDVNILADKRNDTNLFFLTKKYHCLTFNFINYNSFISGICRTMFLYINIILSLFCGYKCLYCI